MYMPPRYSSCKGEPLPWMIPEVPFRSRGLHKIYLKHITNITPGQRNTVAILDIVCVGEKYYLRVFSEYGTEETVVKMYTGHRLTTRQVVATPIERYQIFIIGICNSIKNMKFSTISIII